MSALALHRAETFAVFYSHVGLYNYGTPVLVMQKVCPVNYRTTLSLIESFAQRRHSKPFSANNVPKSKKSKRRQTTTLPVIFSNDTTNRLPPLAVLRPLIRTRPFVGACQAVPQLLHNVKANLRIPTIRRRLCPKCKPSSRHPFRLHCRTTWQVRSYMYYSSPDAKWHPYCTGTPQPIQPLRKQWYDKLADALLGDDESPANAAASRYALICEKCFNHNGLVKESMWEDPRES